MGYEYPGEYIDLGHGRGWLDRAPAESVWRIDAALGHPWQSNEAGRYRWEQQAHYDNYMRYGSPIALHPDTPSLHQKGYANDTNERRTALLNDHGWYHTVYRWVNGVWTLVEPWHYEYFPERDNHRHEGVPAGSAGVPFPGTTKPKPKPKPKEIEMIAVHAPGLLNGWIFLLSIDRIKNAPGDQGHNYAYITDQQIRTLTNDEMIWEMWNHGLAHVFPSGTPEELQAFLHSLADGKEYRTPKNPTVILSDADKDDIAKRVAALLPKE